MTTPNERTRAVIQTGEFLLELSQDSSLPERIRRDAKFLLRHYPDQFQMLLAEQGSLRLQIARSYDRVAAETSI
ncbi:hypothetical protein G0D98_25450 [Pseudomonas savastanoi pv. phaseolicola]|uniref:BPSL0761 family protein n=1 Tax=Pseudomonas savastanoi TaxID=29438 RepID=UPI001969FCD0|nr:BPSL0761 family protein [Pseudomonas savastanoi]MBN3471701.1 hypothetical protein [Pseudomonas savastanoi pv. phaseolicola]MBN3478672.1 hypothetical protein [Pseudomonas savastanoi pv. phaseolicola]